MKQYLDGLFVKPKKDDNNILHDDRIDVQNLSIHARKQMYYLT